jgi:hypothetical protein
MLSNTILYFFENENKILETLNHLEFVASFQETRIQSIYQQNIERLRLGF